MDARTSQQLQLIDEQDSYIQSRADTMQNIESTIVELGSIFQQLAHMVKEQEETIQRCQSRFSTLCLHPSLLSVPPFTVPHPTAGSMRAWRMRS
uniref:t-SNARE coiled-coil homology domain-containing protein n=1 Tax=Amazona collaria TaxID=241587 RepID=A0A8B9F8E7_9PSIT